MNRLQQRLTQIVGAVALITLLGALPAVADPRLYPGTACQPLSEVDTDTRLLRGAGSQVSNRQSDTQLVDCPVLRDQVLSTNGFTAVVVVKGNVQCAIRSLSENGDAQVEVDSATSTGGAGAEELNLEVTQSVAQGPYILGCSMGAFSEVLKYTITENP